MKKRVFVNPVIGDKAILVRSAEETHGEYTLLEIELAPNGGNFLHIHDAYSEKFEVLQGELTLQLEKQHHQLQKGESLTVPKKALHCFSNKTRQPVRFNVEFRPAQRGFERAIAIGYGLAADGMVNKNSIPSKFSHLAILVTMSGTIPAGVAKFFMPVFKWIANRSRKTEMELINKYC